MYTTATTTTRDQALVAAAAAGRAMERHICCKSQFKFMCYSCGEMINRGDSITRCIRPPTGMTLRYRGAGGEGGLTMNETAFYEGQSGENMWVHVGCNPCYWDEGFDNGDEYSPPALRVVPTEWGCKIDREFENWTSGPGGEAWLNMGVSYFLMVKGYPKEKSMRARIFNAVTRFQALWRGYLYKKAYPIARRQAKATESINLNGRITLSTRPRCTQNTRKKEQEDTAHAYRKVWHAQEDKDLTAQNTRKRNMFLDQNSIGAHMEILMDERRTSAAIYSAKVIKIQGVPEIDGLYYWVKYDYDDDVRKYHWKRLLALKLECEAFKSDHGILTPIVGKLPIYPYYPHNTY